MRPPTRTQPDHFIVHVGTNDLSWNVSPNEIARKVVDIAEKLKCEKCHVTILGIILRTDRQNGLK